MHRVGVIGKADLSAIVKALDELPRTRIIAAGSVHCEYERRSDYRSFLDNESIQDEDAKLQPLMHHACLPPAQRS